MFNTINSFRRTTERKTEHSDTEKHILRRKSDKNHKKNQEKSKKIKKNEDLASISIDSIYIFLQSALPNEESFSKVKGIPPQAPQNNKARQAANAYQRQSSKNTPPTAINGTKQKPLTPQEINTIHNLMAKLKILKQKGITRLKILEGQGFLDSLIRAIKHEKV